MAQTCFADCGKFLTMSNDTATTSVTDQLLSFIGTLLDQRVISNVYVEALGRGEVQNPFGSLRVSSDQDIYEPYFTAYLEQSLDKEKIKTWAQEKLRNIKVVSEKREHSQEETISPFVKMKFHKVSGGEFVMGPGRYDKYQHKTRIQLADFAMTETKVTEAMWAEVMHNIPKTKDQNFPFTLPNGQKLNIAPDRPITHVTWWSAIEYANRLSILHGYEPVYIFDKNQKSVGKLEDGSLLMANLQEAKFKINAPNGNIYLAKGFRLPTRAELEYVMSNRGRSKTPYFSNMDDNNFAQYAHFDTSIYAVGERLPLMLDGSAFHDLYGNGEEWTSDFGGNPDEQTAAYLPFDGNTLGMVFKKGNDSANNGYAPQTSTAFDVAGPHADRKTSFRLVRSLP